MITWRPAVRQMTLIWRRTSRQEKYDDHDCRPPDGTRLGQTCQSTASRVGNVAPLGLNRSPSMFRPVKP